MAKHSHKKRRAMNGLVGMQQGRTWQGSAGQSSRCCGLEGSGVHEASCEAMNTAESMT